MVRMAENEREIELAQRLRFRIFCGELGAKANPEVMAEERGWTVDLDSFQQLMNEQKED